MDRQTLQACPMAGLGIRFQTRAGIECLRPGGLDVVNHKIKVRRGPVAGIVARTFVAHRGDLDARGFEGCARGVAVLDEEVRLLDARATEGLAHVGECAGPAFQDDGQVLHRRRPVTTSR